MAASGKGVKAVVAVLGGAGAMGRAVVYDLARSGHPVLLLDQDLAAAKRVARRYGARRAVAETVDARDPAALASRLSSRRARVVVNCAPYALNLAVMQAALLARCHYLDLGGLFHMTRLQLRRDADFRRRGLTAVLGMGSAPGIVNVLARAAAQGLRRVHSIQVYNGGADDTRYEAPLAFPFSPATVLDELTLPPMVFRKGRFRRFAPLSGGEDFLFDVGWQRVYFSLHSEVATLPLSFRDRGIRECAFKIAYDPVLLNKLRLLIDLGLAANEPGPRGVAPRDVLLDCFRRLPPPPDFIDDRDSLAVVVEGEDRRGALTVRYDLTARPERRPPLSAVARDTGFPAAIVARMILSGAIRGRGVLPPERSVPVRPFLRALAERGLPARVAVSR
jgi:saccharopine dehydrogenase-like NADP-dependent oxidoreductase